MPKLDLNQIKQRYKLILDDYLSINPQRQPNESSLSYLFKHILHHKTGQERHNKFLAIYHKPHTTTKDFLKQVYELAISEYSHQTFRSTLTTNILNFLAETLGLKRIVKPLPADRVVPYAPLTSDHRESDKDFYRRIGKKLGITVALKSEHGQSTHSVLSYGSMGRAI